jgi:hypothetical protein
MRLQQPNHALKKVVGLVPLSLVAKKPVFEAPTLRWLVVAALVYTPVEKLVNADQCRIEADDHNAPSASPRV